MRLNSQINLNSKFPNYRNISFYCLDLDSSLVTRGARLTFSCFYYNEMKYICGWKKKYLFYISVCNWQGVKNWKKLNTCKYVMKHVLFYVRISKTNFYNKNIIQKYEILIIFTSVFEWLVCINFRRVQYIILYSYKNHILRTTYMYITIILVWSFQRAI